MSSCVRFSRVVAPAIRSQLQCSSQGLVMQLEQRSLALNPWASQTARQPAWAQSLSVRSFSTTSEGKGEAEAEEPVKAEEEMVEELSEDQKKVVELEKELKEMKDHMLRALADAENTRTIAKRDVSNARQFALTKFAKSLLEVADNLHLAIDSIPPEDLTDNAKLSTLMEGVRMTESSLFKAFHEHDLHKFGERGDKFDPNYHDALFQMDDPELEGGSVGQVVKAGYTLHKRVIRPAQVGAVMKK